MSHPARLAVVETRVEKCEKDIESLPGRFDAIDRRLRNVELLIASGVGVLAVLQIIVGVMT